METIRMFRNNCTLVAIKEVTGADDAAVLAAVRKHNYKDNHGMYADDYMAAARDLGIKFGEMKPTFQLLPTAGTISGWSAKRPTLKAVIAKLTKGTFFVRTRRHVLVVRDGAVIDHNWSKPSLGRETFDYVEVLNAHKPVKTGVLKVARRNSRKYGTSAWVIGQRAFDYIRANPKATAEDVLKNCPGYKKNWLAWDMKRGNIVEV